MDPYNVMGCTASTPLEEIETAYHLLLRQHHPDVHHAEGAEAVVTAERTTRQLNLAMAAIRQGRRAARGSNGQWRYEQTGDTGRRGAGFGGCEYSGPDQWQTQGGSDRRGRADANPDDPTTSSQQADEPVPCPYCGAGMFDLEAFRAHLAEVHRLHDRIPPAPHNRPQPKLIEALGKLRFVPAGLVMLAVLVSALIGLPAWIVLPLMVFLLVVVWAQASPRFKRRPVVAATNSRGNE